MKTETTNPSRPLNLISIIPTDLRAWLAAPELARVAREAAEIFYWLEADEEDHMPFGGCACPLRKLATLTYCYATGTLADDLIALEMVEDPALRSLTGDAVFAPDKLRLFRAHNSELLKLCLARVLEQAWLNNIGECGASRSLFTAEASFRVELAWQADRAAVANALPCSSRSDEALIESETRQTPSGVVQSLVTSAATRKLSAAACFILGLSLWAGQVRAAEVVPAFTHEGKTYTNAVISEANPVDVVFRDGDLGFVRIKRQEMPLALKDRFPYDTRKAEEFEKQQAARTKARREQTRAEIYAALVRQEAEILSRMEKVTEQVVSAQKEIKAWRKKPKGSAGRATALNQLIDQKLNLEKHIDGLNNQVEGVRKLQARYR